MIDQENKAPEQRDTLRPLAATCGNTPPSAANAECRAPFIHSQFLTVYSKGLTYFQIALFFRLCIYAGKAGICNPSTATLARELNATPRGIRGAIDAIEAAGLIRKIGGNVGAGRGNTNRYQIVLEASGDASAIPENRNGGSYFNDMENRNGHDNKIGTAIPENRNGGSPKKNKRKETRKEEPAYAAYAGNLHAHARDPEPRQEQEQQGNYLSFDFSVWDAERQEIRPYSADRIYFRARQIDYHMTVQEVYGFLERMITRMTPTGPVTNLPGLMQSWKRNQAPGKLAQAKEEKEQMRLGVFIPFRFRDEDWERTTPFFDIDGREKAEREGCADLPPLNPGPPERRREKKQEKRFDIRDPNTWDDRMRQEATNREIAELKAECDEKNRQEHIRVIWYENGYRDADAPLLAKAICRIAEKHPRLIDPGKTRYHVAHAILRKQQEGKSDLDAIKEVEQATEQYAAATAKWPEHEHRFIVSSWKWFKEGGYNESPTIWNRESYRDRLRKRIAELSEIPGDTEDNRGPISFSDALSGIND